jgi:hypothetical protein
MTKNLSFWHPSQNDVLCRIMSSIGTVATWLYRGADHRAADDSERSACETQINLNAYCAVATTGIYVPTTQAITAGMAARVSRELITFMSVPFLCHRLSAIVGWSRRLLLSSR